jgi:hypothetical protein
MVNKESLAQILKLLYAEHGNSIKFYPRLNLMIKAAALLV